MLNSSTFAPDAREVARNLRGSRVGGATGDVDFAAESGKLRHNYFVDAREGDAPAFPGVPGIHEERVWTSCEVPAMAEKPGLAYEVTSPWKSPGGGAPGWPVDALVFCAQA